MLKRGGNTRTYFSADNSIVHRRQFTEELYYMGGVLVHSLCFEANGPLELAHRRMSLELSVDAGPMGVAYSVTFSNRVGSSWVLLPSKLWICRRLQG